MKGRGRIRAGAISVIVLAGWLTDGATPWPLRAPDNLVIITLDTARADRLPAYGFGGVAAPAFDRLAREGVVFDRAESVAPLTLTAHTSVFTGLYPPHHGVRDNADAPLDARHTTLAERLHAQGFRTAAFVGSTVLAADRGLARGFDVYKDGSSPRVAAPRRRSAQDVIDEARTWIDGADTTPFFLWIHLYDLHAPQTLPAEYRRTYGDRYEGAIAYIDSQISMLIGALEDQRVLASTAIVVAGDHGESLGEHGEREHGIFLYEPAMHVPLIIRAPGLTPRHVSDLASLVDVVPTALDLLRLKVPTGADGISLLPALRGMGLPERSLYAESMYARRFGWSPLRMLRDDHFKYIDAPRPELYDLETDPFEQRDLSSDRTAGVAAMRASLTAIGLETKTGPTGGAPNHVTNARALASLGYVSAAPTTAAFPSLDPKDYIQIYNSVRGRSAR